MTKKKEEVEKKKLVCVHCGKDELKKIIPIVKLIDSEKELYECKSCKERQYE